jgi:hypothetical protein
MNDEQRFDRTARTWLEDGPTRAPDRAVATALARITTTTQERDLRVPWRFPKMPMLLRAAAAAIVIAVVAGGALFLLRSPSAPGVGAQPSAVPSPSAIASPSPSSTPTPLAAYVAGYDSACERADAATRPLRARFLDTFDGSISETQRADWSDALQQFHDRVVEAVAELDGLTPPADLAVGHAQTVQDYRDQLALIQAIVDALRDRRDADAQAADRATNPIGDRIATWETQHLLNHCP